MLSSATAGAKNDDTTGDSAFLSSLHPNDVLLGRGQHIRHVGNSQFRKLVRERVVEYTTCRNKAIKDGIAREIIQTVQDSGGRFVRKVLDTAAARASPTTSSSNPQDTAALWEIADEATILVKVKQTFRDYSVVARKAAAAGSQDAPSPAVAAPPAASILLQTTANQSGVVGPVIPESIYGPPLPYAAATGPTGAAAAAPEMRVPNPATNAASGNFPSPELPIPPNAHFQQWIHMLQQQQLLEQFQQRQQQIETQQRLSVMLAQQRELESAIQLSQAAAAAGVPHVDPSFAATASSSLQNGMQHQQTAFRTFPTQSDLVQQQPIDQLRSMMQASGVATLPGYGTITNPLQNPMLDLESLIRLQQSMHQSFPINTVERTNQPQQGPTSVHMDASPGSLVARANTLSSARPSVPFNPPNPETTSDAVLPSGSPSCGEDAIQTTATQSTS